MKRLISISIVLITMGPLLSMLVSATPTVTAMQTEFGQLKVCKVARSGVAEGMLFTFRVNGITYSVPAGPPDNGYCVLAGQYPVNSEVMIEEVIPSSYYVSQIEVRPDRTVSKDTPQGIVTLRIINGVIEAIFTNKVAGPPTPTSVHTFTPRPTRTPLSCYPNCPITPTPIPRGRMQICKEAEGPDVTGYFTFQFGSRSKSVPVGACTGLISVDAGTWTIAEVPQAGYTVADIYTIPADRLLSKDLNGGRADVRIVEGKAASQTIVIFRNRADPPPCEPEVIYATFDDVPAGQSVEGMGKVAPYLDIKAKRQAVRVLQAVTPLAYVAPNHTGVANNGETNGGLIADGGFADLQTVDLREAHNYSFTFDPDITVTDFSLHMFDYGDYNPSLATSHAVVMTAYDAENHVLDLQELRYTTSPEKNPRSSDQYGDLRFTGDAVHAPLGQPGNWFWRVSGDDIAKIVLEFTEGYDPNIAFDHLSFRRECGHQTLFSAEFSAVSGCQSVEGVGIAAPYLDIQAKGQAVRVLQATAHRSYESPNDTRDLNGGLIADGGFSDLQTVVLPQPHRYTFTFDPDITVTSFSLHMLDYGDYNPSRATAHYASMTAYDADSNVVDRDELSYTTPAEVNPRSSDRYGDLRINGDAIDAPLGQPGNWIWRVSGDGIVRVELVFGFKEGDPTPYGYDPNIAFDQLYFTISDNE